MVRNVCWLGRQWVAGWVVKGERERPVVRGRETRQRLVWDAGRDHS